MNRARHRNGVYGVPFAVACTLDKAGRPHRLVVKFYDRRSIRVRLNTLVRDMFKAKPLGKYREAWAGLSGKVYAVASSGLPGACKIIAYTDGQDRFIGVYDGWDDCCPRFAAVRLDLLPSVEFGVNSWRGDHHCQALKAYLD